MAKKRATVNISLEAKSELDNVLASIFSNDKILEDYLHSIFDATKQKGFGIPSIY